MWIIGHSLGGALAGLLGNTFGAPVVAFDAPGEKMAAARLHLPTPVRPASFCFLVELTINHPQSAFYSACCARVSHS